MNRATTGFILALTLSAGMLAQFTSHALADGDPYYSNGINASGVRTPVPAPVPVPVEEAEWYFRGDFAAGFGSSPSVNVLGANLIEQNFGTVTRGRIASSPRSPAASASVTSGVRTSAPI